MLERSLMEHLPGSGKPGAAGDPVTLNIATNADSLGTWFLRRRGRLRPKQRLPPEHRHG